MATEKTTKDGQNPGSVKVRYETTEVTYVSQFMINAGAEELILNFSPGYLSDPNEKDNVLPIHSRIALTYSGAARLVQTLSQVLKNVNEARQKTQTSAQEASLPKIN